VTGDQIGPFQKNLISRNLKRTVIEGTFDYEIREKSRADRVGGGKITLHQRGIALIVYKGTLFC